LPVNHLILRTQRVYSMFVCSRCRLGDGFTVTHVTQTHTDREEPHGSNARGPYEAFRPWLIGRLHYWLGD